MTELQIRTLRAEDDQRLLDFELGNRHWFEQHIAPRGDSFYSVDGVRAHIAQFLADHHAGIFHPCVLLDATGAIIGRANLKHINPIERSAEVGYRIGAAFVGRGLAPQAVRHLIDQARHTWDLEKLAAVVRRQNTASSRVLVKCGFERMESDPAEDRQEGPLDHWQLVLGA